MKKSLLLIFVVMFIYPLNVWAKQFKDVPYGYWDYKAVNEITDAGIMNGVSGDYFMPEKLITRAEYATGIIKTVKRENITVQNAYAFDDINNKHWAWQYIIRALDLDILQPVSQRYFAPDDFVTRTEILTFLVNILKSEGITRKEALTALQNNYSDFDEIPDWFKVTAGKAEILGVVAKEPPRENYLDCDKYITRAQFAYFLNKLKEITEGYENEKKLAEISPKIVERGGIIIENTFIDEDVVTIPERTILPIEILKPLKSGKTPVGTMFHAKFAGNLVDYKKRLLLSEDVILTGKVLSSEKSFPLIKNGSIVFEISSTNKDGNLTRIQALADCKPKKSVKGYNFNAKSGQILYVKLYKPLRVNIVTGDILD